MGTYMNEEQAQFIDLLLAGKTEEEAMAEMGVSPETVTRWTEESSLFDLILFYQRSPELQTEVQTALWGKAQRLMVERLELHRQQEEPGADRLGLILKLAANRKELDQVFKDLDTNPLRPPE